MLAFTDDGVDDSPLRACNDWDKAEEILSMMKSRAIKPNQVTYTELIGICGRSGDVHQALVSETKPVYCCYTNAALCYRCTCCCCSLCRVVEPNPCKIKVTCCRTAKSPEYGVARFFLSCGCLSHYSLGWRIGLFCDGQQQGRATLLTKTITALPGFVLSYAVGVTL